MSPAFRRFLDSLHTSADDREHADDFDVGALAQLGAAERVEAERLLLDRMAKEPSDSRVPGALALVGGPASVAPLREAFAKAGGYYKCRVTATLAAVDPAFDAVQAWLDLLLDESSAVRAEAARALARAPRERVRGRLLEALDDRSSDLRLAAFGSLLELYGLEPLRRPPFSPLRAIGTRLLSGLVSVFRPAAEEMRALVCELDAGRRPRQLGLEPDLSDAMADTLERLAGSLRPESEAVDRAALGRLDARGRRLVECLLLGQLDRGEPRVLEAILALRLTSAVAPLREALARDPGPFRGPELDEERARMAAALATLERGA